MFCLSFVLARWVLMYRPEYWLSWVQQFGLCAWGKISAFGSLLMSWRMVRLLGKKRNGHMWGSETFFMCFFAFTLVKIIEYVFSNFISKDFLQFSWFLLVRFSEEATIIWHNLSKSFDITESGLVSLSSSTAIQIVTDRTFGSAELIGLAQMTEPFSAEHRTFFFTIYFKFGLCFISKIKWNCFPRIITD